MEHYEVVFMIAVSFGTGIFIGAILMMFFTANYALDRYKEGYELGIKSRKSTESSN